ncbi:MAG: MFS transporter [Solirubrobacteraceae bacterium]
MNAIGQWRILMLMNSSQSTMERRPRNGYRFGFVAVAFAFLAVLAFSTVPTPLWSLYAQRDGFSSLTITLLFTAYAVGVAASLFLVGHVSDWQGRRRVLVPALVVNILAAVVFLLWPQADGLLAARIINGLGVGAVNATATAWLVELRTGYRGDGAARRAQAVAAAVNLAGLGCGALISGLLAQWAGDPLSVPFVVVIAAMSIALLLVLAAPETHPRPRVRPRYRPQRVSVPMEARGRFFAAAAAAAITFALFGLLTSLAPSFLAGTLHDRSRALAGAVSFAAFAIAALAQLLSGSRAPRELLAAAVPTILAGLGLLTAAVWLPQPSLGVFIAGVLVGGAGSGLMFKGAIGTVASIAAPENRAEALAGLFLAAYLGLAGPVIGLGLLTRLVSAKVSLLVFAGVLAGGVLVAAPRLLGRRTPTSSNDTGEHDATHAVADHSTRNHWSGDHSDRPRRLGHRRRRLGVRLGTTGRR